MDAHQHRRLGAGSLHPLPGSISSFLVLHVQLLHRDGAKGVGCCIGKGGGEGGRDLRGAAVASVGAPWELLKPLWEPLEQPWWS